MKIYNENKTKELNIEELDFSKGYLKEEYLTIYHEEIKGQKEDGVKQKKRKW